jgi:hypothetical protein
MTEEIFNQWIIFCFEKLSLSQRHYKNDSAILNFIKIYFNKQVNKKE